MMNAIEIIMGTLIILNANSILIMCNRSSTKPCPLWAMGTNRKARKLPAHCILSLLLPLKGTSPMATEGKIIKESRCMWNRFRLLRQFLIFQCTFIPGACVCLLWRAAWMVWSITSFHSCGTIILMFLLLRHWLCSDTLNA